MLIAGSNKRIFAIDGHIGGVVAGYSADGRQIIQRAREEAQSYQENFGLPVLPAVLANRLALFVHFYTLHYSLRPFGSSLLFAGFDVDTKSPELYMIDPAGLVRRYFGCAAGKGAQAANTEIDKLFAKCGGVDGVSCEDAIRHIAQMYVLGVAIVHLLPFELQHVYSSRCKQ